MDAMEIEDRVKAEDGRISPSTFASESKNRQNSFQKNPVELERPANLSVDPDPQTACHGVAI
jgi:hypothetical protein